MGVVGKVGNLWGMHSMNGGIHTKKTRPFFGTHILNNYHFRASRETSRFRVERIRV